jgi:hypothetical protein
MKTAGANRTGPPRLRRLAGWGGDSEARNDTSVAQCPHAETEFPRSFTLGCAANQQQYSPEMTGFPARTERHCCGMVEGRGPSLDPAPPAQSPVRGFGGDGARRRRYRRRSNDVTEQTYRHAAGAAVRCQSASKFDPRSASNFDPLERRVRAVALAPSELVGVAETARARVVG